MTMGEKLLKLRKARGWSQEEMAERVGVTRQAISRWESDAAKPDADNIITVCDLFGVSSDYLLRDGMGSGDSGSLPVPEAQSPADRYRSFSTVIGGSVLAGLSVLMLFGIGIASAMNPHTVVLDNSVYTGMMGYIIGNKLQWLLFLMIALLLTGTVMLLHNPIIRAAKAVTVWIQSRRGT